MAIYRGSVAARLLVQTIHDAITANGWTYVQSSIGDDGRVYKTTGISGQNEFFIQIVDLATYYLRVGVWEKYTAGAVGMPGTFTQGYQRDIIAWNRSQTSQNLIVDYIINVNKDRIILHVQGRKVDTNWCSSLSYIGLPKRYDTADTGPYFAGMAYSTAGLHGEGWRSLRNRALIVQPMYTFDYYSSPRAIGWGEKVFFSPVVIGNTDEGPRGELSGLYTMTAATSYEARHQDEFTRDGKRYMIISRDNDYNTNRSLPGTWYVIEI